MWLATLYKFYLCYLLLQFWTYFIILGFPEFWDHPALWKNITLKLSNFFEWKPTNPLYIININFSDDIIFRFFAKKIFSFEYCNYAKIVKKKYYTKLFWRKILEPTLYYTFIKWFSYEWEFVGKRSRKWNFQQKV